MILDESTTKFIRWEIISSFAFLGKNEPMAYYAISGYRMANIQSKSHTRNEK